MTAPHDSSPPKQSSKQVVYEGGEGRLVPAPSHAAFLRSVAAVKSSVDIPAADPAMFDATVPVGAFVPLPASPVERRGAILWRLGQTTTGYLDALARRDYKLRSDMHLVRPRPPDNPSTAGAPHHVLIVPFGEFPPGGSPPLHLLAYHMSLYLGGVAVKVADAVPTRLVSNHSRKGLVGQTQLLISDMTKYLQTFVRDEAAACVVGGMCFVYLVQ